ncbi:hypothetical protein [Rhodococcus aerolatus]
MDSEGYALAAAWRNHPRAPRWARMVSAAAWSGLLALPARHGWTAADLNELLNTHLRAGRVIPPRPDRPVGFLSWLLTRTDLTTRPTLALDAHRAADYTLAQQRKAEQAQHRQDAPAIRAAARAALNGPGHAAARAVIDGVGHRRRERRNR